MITVPDVLPVAMPEVAPIDATPVLLLVQVPPVVALVNDVVAPTHTVALPDTGSGNGLTDIVRVM